MFTVCNINKLWLNGYLLPNHQPRDGIASRPNVKLIQYHQQWLWVETGLMILTDLLSY